MNHQKGVRVFEVSFDKSVWVTILKERWKLLFTVLEVLLQNAFGSAVAVLIGYSFDRQEMNLFLIICVVWIVMVFLSVLSFYFYSQALSNIISSARYSASKYFLTVDPKYHATKSSGKIIAKITRGTDSFEVFLDTLIIEIIGFFGNLVATAVAMALVDWRLSLIAIFSYILITLISIATRYLISKEVLPVYLKSDDIVKERTYEVVQQAIYIRSLFASGLLLKNFYKRISIHASTLSTFWFSGIFLTQSVRFIYIVSVFVIGAFYV
jgi:ABC-type multidrug transport system fused ATPase/permease subunit